MRYLILSISFVICIHCAKAQDYSWFQGSWYGMKSFSGARLGIKAPVRIEIDSMYDDGQFTGRFIYMYPKDTIARLVKTFTGNITGYAISLNISEEKFLLDPRSRSFWSNCAACSETGSFYFNDTALVFKISTDNCGDSCNGESVFARKINYYKPPEQAEIRHFFSDSIAVINAARSKGREIQPPKKASLVVNSNKKKSSKQERNTPDSIIVKGNPKWISDAEDSITLTQNKAGGINSFYDSGKIYTAININSNDPDQQDAGYSDTNKNDAPVAILNKDEFADTVSVIHNEKPLTLLSTESIDTAMHAKINRETALASSYYVDSPHIEVDLFDNGTIDSDAVSVYYNGKLIVNNAMLSYKAVSFSIDASATDRHLEFILIAENEGSIPPNSALMRITSGKKQFKLFVSTSITKNVKIAFDYTGP